MLFFFISTLKRKRIKKVGEKKGSHFEYGHSRVLLQSVTHASVSLSHSVCIVKGYGIIRIVFKAPNDHPKIPYQDLSIQTQLIEIKSQPFLG